MRPPGLRPAPAADGWRHVESAPADAPRHAVAIPEARAVRTREDLQRYAFGLYEHELAELGMPVAHLDVRVLENGPDATVLITRRSVGGLE